MSWVRASESNAGFIGHDKRTYVRTYVHAVNSSERARVLAGILEFEYPNPARVTTRGRGRTAIALRL